MTITEDTKWLRVPEEYDDQNMIDEIPGLAWIRFWTEIQSPPHTKKQEVYLFDFIVEGEDDPPPADQASTEKGVEILNMAEELVGECLEILERTHGSSGPEEDHPDRDTYELALRLNSTFGMGGWA